MAEEMKKEMNSIEVIIADFENNPRGDLSKKYGTKLCIARGIASELGLRTEYENYLVIPQDGNFTTYCSGGSGSGSLLDPPSETGTELEKEMGDFMFSYLENPHIEKRDRRILGIKIGEEKLIFPSKVYPNNTLLFIDKRFEQVMYDALDLLGFKPVVHYDHMQPSLF